MPLSSLTRHTLSLKGWRLGAIASSLLCSGLAGGGLLLASLPFATERLGFYALLASAASIQLVVISLVGVLLGALGLTSARTPRSSWIAFGLALLTAALNAVPPLRQMAVAQSRGISLSPWDSIVAPSAPAAPPLLVTFAQGDGWRLDADVYRPTSPSPRTVVVLAHGGGWNGGDKGEVAAWSRWFAQRGYVVVDAQYRLAPKATWRESVDDLQTAVAWVRAHAADVGGDPNRIVLAGRSAGGHLALLAAYRSQAPPIAVIALYAPTDLEQLYVQSPSLRPGMPEPASLAAASPINYVRADVPPTLLVHGTSDETVPVEHTRRLAARLASSGASVQVLEVPFGHHAFDLVPDALNSQLARAEIAAFLDTL